MQATINGERIGFDDIGQGPVVLFVHDTQHDRSMWQAQVEPLVAAGFRVVLVDRRGSGGSTGVADGPETDSADLIGLLDYLGIGRAAVCGIGYRGTALEVLAKFYPHRIAGVYLAGDDAGHTPDGVRLAETIAATSRPLGGPCNPITHQRPGERTRRQPRSEQSLSGGASDNAQELNRRLLAFLTRLAPRRKGDGLTLQTITT